MTAWAIAPFMRVEGRDGHCGVYQAGARERHGGP